MNVRSLYLPDFPVLLERYRNSCEIRPGLPTARTYEEALYTPALAISHDAAGQPEIRGDLFDRSGARIASAGLVREHRRLNGGEPGAPCERVDGRGIYLGWLIPTYGHALLEGLARAWALRDLDLGPFDYAVFHAPYPVKEPPEYLAAHLRRLGSPPSLVPQSPSRFEALTVPDAAFEIKSRAYRGFLETFPRRHGEDGMPVYVSRSGLGGRERPIAGESILEKALDGYRVVHPETMPLPEQIDVFHRHATFVGPLGSGMHNILFSESPQVTYLTAPEPNLNFLMCDELVDAHSRYVGCCDDGGLPSLGSSTPLRLDLARAAEALELTIDPALQDRVDHEHRELWAERRLTQGVEREYDRAIEEIRQHLDGTLPPKLGDLARRLDPRDRMQVAQGAKTTCPGKGRRGGRRGSDRSRDAQLEHRLARARAELAQERQSRSPLQASLSSRITRFLRAFKRALSCRASPAVAPSNKLPPKPNDERRRTRRPKT